MEAKVITQNKTIEYNHLSVESKIIRFYNELKQFNFSKVSTHICIYYNNEATPRKDFFAEKHIYDKNQPHSETFEIIIPHGSKSARIFLETTTIGYDLGKVKTTIIA
jgi:hypothetical protein